MKQGSNSWRLIGTSVWAVALTSVLGWVIWRYGQEVGLLEPGQRISVFLLIILMAAVGLFAPRLLIQLKRLNHRDQGQVDKVYPQPDAPLTPSHKPAFKLDELICSLHVKYGFFWRLKVRFFIVFGEPEQITAIAPSLTQDHWLEGQNTVLLWGGSVHTKLDESLLAQWRALSRWRALDGVVWALSSDQSADDAAMAAGVRYLRYLSAGLRWQLPLHLWQVCDSQWPQAKRQVDAVGCRLPQKLTAAALETRLAALIEPLRNAGWAQMKINNAHDFLLRLARDLGAEGIPRWCQALAPLFGQFARGVPLRGLWFSLPVERISKDHFWPIDPAWEGVLRDKPFISRVGWSTPRIGYALAMSLALVWAAGLLLSYASNRALISHVQTSLTALQHSRQGDEQFRALHELTRELGRLDYRAEHGTPWHQRFGLNQNQALLDTLWPRYVEANHRLMRDPAAANLQRQLMALIQLAPDSPERASEARVAYGQLKAYLMLAHPEKTDAEFLAKTLNDAEPLRPGVSPGLWQTLSPDLWQFYSEQLSAHPEWRIPADPKLIAQARQVLLGQLGQRNAEASLYQQVLDASINHSPALELRQMVGATDAQALFSSDARVPGVFTRQAWEGQVSRAIDDIAEARREQIDWVLSDQLSDIASDLTPAMLKKRLTEHYFDDYASAWLDFLNSLRWHPSDSLPDVIDQLTLMSDARQSPLIALMNTVAYQGQAGTRGQGLKDTLVKSAQQLIGQDKVEMIDPPLQTGPLEATFGPLLSLMSQEKSLNLHTFLTQVTRARLKLQQISHAPDPQGMTQALAQSVFQGKSIDLTDTQSYGSLIAASLGAEWSGLGETLFVQPLDHAWQRVLQPSAASLNRQWQRAIVTPWHSAFASRYPFAATASDASLPMLGQMIRADSGRIEQFLQSQLGGVLRKEGNRWVADRHSQGLRFNPQFLAAINQLSDLADVLYTDGGMGLSFELQGKAARDIVQTTFILNGERHHYFNQQESWQRFNWPGRSDYPGASLSWTSVHTGERLFGDYQGTWGLIRLLEKARLTALDDGDSRYRMVLKAPDGLDLTWHLRTELDAGPLALLKLRGFTLPAQIFLTGERSEG
ncbi:MULTISPECIES: ImcF-related family protein [unclassified Pseudomonas]|uniref:ImcF-related family protein n=1 Tax=unclassified Pseudomonas TaxID=196821 RepID=UPI002166C680|nr:MULTISPECIES: ImcF-related family protein [unclassified Pseudomonas]